MSTFIREYTVDWNIKNNGAGERFIHHVWPDDTDSVMEVYVEFSLETYQPLRAAKLALDLSQDGNPQWDEEQNEAVTRPIEWVPVNTSPERFVAVQQCGFGDRVHVSGEWVPAEEKTNHA